MAAEELGIPYEKVRTTVVDTASLGYNDVSHGSRVTYASGLATIKAARDAKKKLCARAAKIWGIDEDAVEWEDGMVKPVSQNAGEFDPLPFYKLCRIMGRTGGPISGHYDARRGGRIVRDPHRRRGGRPGNGRRQGRAVYDRAGRREGDPPVSRASSRAGPRRASAGR